MMVDNMNLSHDFILLFCIDNFWIWHGHEQKKANSGQERDGTIKESLEGQFQNSTDPNFF